MTKILLVEDDKALRQMYGERLLAEGYDIVSAGDGEEALSMAINELPDLIISDVMMPKISGFEMLDLLKTNTKTSGIKVIIMTALGGDQQKQRGDRLGANRYLVKSQVGIEDVVNTVKQVLSENATSSPNAASSPATPAPNQSSFNPAVATSPSSVIGSQPVKLPDTPFSVPAITTVPLPQPKPPVHTPAPTPVFAPTPTPAPAQTPQAAPQPVSLPPVPGPSGGPAHKPEVPSFQPVNKSDDEDDAVNEQPQMAPLPGSGLRTIEPTGESLNPKLDINGLIAREEATEIAPNLSSVVTPNLDDNNNPDATDNQPTQSTQDDSEPASGVPSIQVDESGTINFDQLADEAPSNDIFPTQ